MRKICKKTTGFIPKTLILTKDIPERFETTYMTTLTETVPHRKLHKLQTNSDRAVAIFVDCANQLDLIEPDHKLFQIYNPTAETVFLLNVSDAEKPKVTINTLEKLQQLERMRDCVRAMLYLKRGIGGFEFQVKTLYDNRHDNYMRDALTEVSQIQTQVSASMVSADKALAVLRHSFLTAFIEY